AQDRRQKKRNFNLFHLVKSAPTPADSITVTGGKIPETLILRHSQSFKIRRIRCKSSEIEESTDVGPVVGASEISTPGGDGLYDYIKLEGCKTCTLP
uniref:Uncharacterized protein n=1 Tax=Oryza nivara TaxID=4536 RepID=A0A0E0FFH2_ORYNI